MNPPCLVSLRPEAGGMQQFSYNASGLELRVTKLMLHGQSISCYYLSFECSTSGNININVNINISASIFIAHR